MPERCGLGNKTNPRNAASLTNETTSAGLFSIFFILLKKNSLCPLSQSLLAGEPCRSLYSTVDKWGPQWQHVIQKEA